jgi:hypothetical protein
MSTDARQQPRAEWNFDATPERAESQKSPKSKPSSTHGQ